MIERAAIIGIGLIGSSLAHAWRKHKLVRHITIIDTSADHLKKAEDLDLGDAYSSDFASVKETDLVMLCVPVGVMGAVAEKIAPHLKRGALVSDVGSVKQAVEASVKKHIPPHAQFVAGHPIAGTEHSGPASGFAELFEGRWCILAPDTGHEKLKQLWEACGAKVALMEAAHHDRVLAITSHLPHLIAYTIVGTAANLEDEVKSEVIQYSASGFRDSTRLAASDPTMWRDIFLNNQTAVLDILQRFTEDLTGLQKAIRNGDGQVLFDFFTRTRGIRKEVIEAKQA